MALLALLKRRSIIHQAPIAHSTKTASDMLMRVLIRTFELKITISNGSNNLRSVSIHREIHSKADRQYHLCYQVKALW